MQTWGMKEWDKWQQTSPVPINRKVVVLIVTPWCGTCQLAEKMIGIVESMHPSCRFVRMDIQQIPYLRDKYKISSVPCLWLVHGKKIIKQVYAIRSVTSIHELLLEHQFITMVNDTYSKQEEEI